MRCRIRTVGSIVAVAIATGAAQLVSASASSDCAKAKPDSVEHVICDSPLLAALDAETARLFALASAGPDRAPAQAEQQTWLAERDACASRLAPDACLRDRFLERIAWLRASSPAARSADAAGISLGPVAFRCEKTDGVLAVTFVNAPPQPLAYAALGTSSFFFEQAISGSGARYLGIGDAKQLFWTKGDGAQFRAGADSPEVSCKVERSG